MPRALIGMGSNLGDRGQLLRSAVEQLRAALAQRRDQPGERHL